jgi:hypothetical protein
MWNPPRASDDATKQVSLQRELFHMMKTTRCALAVAMLCTIGVGQASDKTAVRGRVEALAGRSLERIWSDSPELAFTRTRTVEDLWGF